MAKPDTARPVSSEPSLGQVRPTCLAMRVQKAQRVVTRQYEKALRPLDLTAAQFTLLVHVMEGAGRSISFLAQVMRVERTTLTRNLRLLERKGLIALSAEGVRRQRSIDLLPAGQDALEQGLPLWKKAQDHLAHQLGDDWEPTRRLLERLARLDDLDGT